MKTFLIAASCVAFLGGVTAASAQFNGPPIETGTTMSKSNADTGMQSNAKMMKKKKMKKGMMKTDKKM